MGRRAPLPLIACLLAACSSPRTEFYTLTPETDGAARLAYAGAPVGFRHVDLPPALDRRAMVRRIDEHRVDVRGTERWAAPLDQLLSHVLAADLAARLPEGSVVLPGQPAPLDRHAELTVLIEDLTAWPDRVELVARWTLVPDERGATGVTRTERIVVPLPGGDGEADVAEEAERAAAAAAAMSRALALLAGRMAQGIVEASPLASMGGDRAQP